MKTNNELKTEFDIYNYEVSGYISTFIQEVADGNAHVVERTVAQMKQRFALDDAQEAALQIALFHFMLMLQGMRKGFPMDSLVGMEGAVITHIMLKEWREICDKNLTDEGMDCMEDDDEDVAEAFNAYRDLLIDYYGTVSGKAQDKKVEKIDVFKAFFIPKDYHEPALCILDGFKEKMDGFFKTGASKEAVADLLDDTIEKMVKLVNMREDE